MSTCKFCGEKTGWFKDAHDACVKAATDGITEVKSLVTSAVEQAVESGAAPSIQSSIEQVVAKNRVPNDMVSTSVLAAWNSAAADAAVREPLTAQKQKAILVLLEQLGFTQAQVSMTNGFRSVCLSTLLWGIMEDVSELYTNAMVSRNPFNLKPGEVPISFFGSVVYSQQTSIKSRQGGFGGMSVRVAPGVYSHFGGFKGEQVERWELKEIDYGGMMLTTKALYFGGITRHSDCLLITF